MIVCSTCGLSKDLCVCEDIAKGRQEIKIMIQKKKFGKEYTVIKGLNEKEIDIKDVAKKLKNRFACGGTAKNGKIELQGNHIRTQDAKKLLKDAFGELGFSQDTINIK